MIDFHVAYEKLASLQSCEDLADFFRHQGIKGTRQHAELCPITEWMTQQTGLNIRTNTMTVRAVRDVERGVALARTIEGTDREHTPAMASFVINFDLGLYSDLIAE